MLNFFISRIAKYFKYKINGIKLLFKLINKYYEMFSNKAIRNLGFSIRIKKIIEIFGCFKSWSLIYKKNLCVIIYFHFKVEETSKLAKRVMIKSCGKKVYNCHQIGAI